MSLFEKEGMDEGAEELPKSKALEIDLEEQKSFVRKFYEVFWNEHDLTAADELFDDLVVFRGSLGENKVGRDGIKEYVNSLHGALSNYKCEIEEMVSEGGRVFAKVLFHGDHTGDLMGYSPSQKHVSWIGCALFKFKCNRISEIWVLGDLLNLIEQLRSA